MNDRGYINIQGWMINQLKLKGNELILFALIFGFSQDGTSAFYGSLSYIEKALHISRPTAISLLKKLIEKGLVKKLYQSHYQVVKKLYRTSKETLPFASKETLPNIYNTNNNYNNKREMLAKKKVEKRKYGEFKNVKLSDEELKKLIEKAGEQATQIFIVQLDGYIESNGKKYKSHYATILNWLRREKIDTAKLLKNKGTRII